MNPHASLSASPQSLIQSFWQHRRLIMQMVWREVVGRYRGSVLGILWSFFTPLFMLTIYTFVFSVIFKARWGATGGDSKTEFALLLFAGLIVYNLFAECLSRSPTLILSNATYVKKVVFPLEILPWVSMGSALFHALVSLIVWMIAYLIFFGIPHPVILLLPVTLLPFIMLIMGISWALASLGVYLRDISNLIGIFLTAMMFLAPIFYPISALPEKYRPFLYINPLTPVVEQVRSVLFWGTSFSWSIYIINTMVSVCVAWIGFAWFQKTRSGFADVL